VSRPRMGSRVWVRIPDAQLAAIDAAAERDGRTRSDWMRRAMARALEGAMSQSPSVSQWIVPPSCQGQMIEHAYGQDSDGQCWERVSDRSARTVTYRDLGHVTEISGAWDPWIERPACAR